MYKKTFKTCPACHKIWETQKAFISDPSLGLNGYKADFEKLEYGLLFFTHHEDNCHSTLAIEVNDFINLYRGPIHPERKTGAGECPGYCRKSDQLDRCDAICECAYVREILHAIKSAKNV